MGLIAFLFSLQLLLVVVLSESCESLEPLQLAITDIQVISSIPGSYMRGVAAKIGTSEQDIVLLPWV